MQKSTFKNKLFDHKRAFTLIELLIVIAIIGILFIVLVSKVDFATDKAKASGVQTDFRSFQMAFDTVAKENAGFNTFGWDTGDANQDGIRNSYDEGDTNKNSIQDGTEVFTGHKVYSETFTKVFSLKKAKADGTLETNYDRNALNRLETAINANLDPKLYITIKDDGEIVMANGAQDPWNKEYHGWYITNAETDKKDRGAIVMYSDGANNEFGSEHKIANGVVTVSIPGNNKAGKDDYSIVSVYTYINGYGEVKNITTGFSNNQTFLTGNGNGNSENNNGVNGGSDDDIPDVDPVNLEAGLYDSSNKQLASWSTLVNTYGLDVAKKYTATDYLTSTTSLYYIINNNPKLSAGTKLIIGDDATQISSYALAGCENLTDIVINDNTTSIGKGSLMDCNNLKTITTPFVSQNVGVSNGTYLGWFFGIENEELPNSLTTVIVTNTTKIGNSCFKECTNLTNIVLPNTLTSIGADAFEGCTGITTINIPDSVTTFGHSAFCESGIENIVLPNSLTSLSGEAFYNCKNLKSVTIPSSITEICVDAFKNCDNLNIVNITDLTSWLKIDLKNHYSQPMRYAKELLLNGQSITGDLIIPDEVTILREYALKGTKIESIVINDNTTSISKGFLMDCNNLKTITTPFVSQNVGVSNGTYLGWFFGIENEELPNSLTTVIVTNTTTIGSSCFDGCANLTNIVLPNTLTSIGFYAFEGCTGLTTINIPNSVTTIHYRAFYESGIENIVLPNSLTSLSSEAFYNCKNLKSVTIPSSITEIGLDAFRNCDNLNTVNITDLTSWLNIEFKNSYSQPMLYAKELLLNSQPITGDLIISDEVTILREYALKGTKIKSIVIHDNIEAIRKGCLTECNNLQMITTPFIGQTFSSDTILGWFFDVNSSTTQNQFIPSSLTTVVITRATRIANRCFEGCVNIKTIIIPDTVQNIDGYAFYNCSGITNIHIPEGVSNIGWDLFYGCTGLTTVNIPVSVTYLSEKAFAKSSISTIVFDGTMEQWNDIQKDSKWKTDSVLTTIQCSDGTIQLT